MTEIERTFLEDTRDTLIGCDGFNSTKGLVGLIAETKERLSRLLAGEITEEEV